MTAARWTRSQTSTTSAQAATSAGEKTGSSSAATRRTGTWSRCGRSWRRGPRPGGGRTAGAAVDIRPPGRRPDRPARGCPGSAGRRRDRRCRVRRPACRGGAVRTGREPAMRRGRRAGGAGTRVDRRWVMAAPMLCPMKISRPSVGGSLSSAARTPSTASSGTVTGGVRRRLARPGAGRPRRRPPGARRRRRGRRWRSRPRAASTPAGPGAPEPPRRTERGAAAAGARGR